MAWQSLRRLVRQQVHTYASSLTANQHSAPLFCPHVQTNLLFFATAAARAQKKEKGDTKEEHRPWRPPSANKFRLPQMRPDGTFHYLKTSIDKFYVMRKRFYDSRIAKGLVGRPAVIYINRMKGECRCRICCPMPRIFFFHAPGRTNFCKPLAKNRKKKKKKTLIFFLHLWLYALVEQLSWKIFFPADSTRCPSSCWMVVYCMIVLLLLLLYPADWPWSLFFPCRNNL